MPIIDRHEWSWAIKSTLFFVILVSVPYLYGALVSTEANQFGGFVIAVEDGNSYLAKMQEGGAGHWRFYLAYTPEPHRAEFFFIFYILLGQLSQLFNMAPIWILSLSRLVVVPFGLLSYYYFAAFFVSDVLTRRLAFLLYGFTAGLGWLWLAVGFPVALGAMPVDLWVPEASYFLLSLTYPHLPLAQGLLLWVAIAGLRFLDNGRFGFWALAAGAGVLVSLIHPYKLVIIGPVFVTYLVWQRIKNSRPLALGIWRLALIMLPALPYLLYAVVAFESNFAFKVWRDQNLTLSPHPVHYILGFGLLLPLAAVGIWHSRRLPGQYLPFLIGWVLVIPLLLYSPIVLQRRFLDGYSAALAVMGGIGFVWLGHRLRTDRQRLFVFTIVLGGMAFTNLFLLAGTVTVTNARSGPIFHAGDQQAAFRWLALNGPGSVVLAAYETGNVIPAYAPVRVFVGHGSETVYSTPKRAMLPEIFSTESGQIRTAVFQDYHIGYLYYGPVERALGDYSPGEDPGLRLVYDNDTIQIYRVLQEN